MTPRGGGDTRRIALFFAAAVLIGAYWSLSATVGDTLFLAGLARGGYIVARWLPWLYVLVAAGAVSGTWAFTVVQRRLSRRALVVVAPLALGVTLGALRLFLALDLLAIRAAIAVAGEVSAQISVMLFFSVAGDHFSSRDAKRLYGMVWGGLPVGVLAGGALVGPLVAAQGVPNLLWIAIALLGGTGILYGVAERRTPPAARPLRTAQPAAGASIGDGAVQPPLPTLLGDPYARLLVWLSFFTAVLFVCADLPMKWLVSGMPPQQMARFFGLFYVTVGISEILIQYTLSRLLMTGLGATNSLFVFPALVGSACVAMVTAPRLATATIASWLRAVTSETVEGQARELHWLALPERIRHRLQPWVSGAVVPGGQGAAGLLLAALAAGGWQLRAAPVVGVAAAGLVLLIVLRLRPLYLAALGDAVRYHLLDEGALGRLLRAPENRALARSLLASGDDEVRAMTAELLGRAEADGTAPIPADVAARVERTLDAMALTRRARDEAGEFLAPFLDDHLETRWRELLHLWSREAPERADVFDRVRVNLWTASHSEALDLLDAHLDRDTAARVLPLAAKARDVGPGLSASTRAALRAAGGWLALVAEDGDNATAHGALARIAGLKKLALFADVPRDLLAPVAALADRVTLAPGTQLFAQGAAPDALYAVELGRVTLRADGVDVGELGPGESLGELALLDGAPRSAAAVARSECRLTRIAADPFRALLASEASLVLALLRTLCARLRATQGAEDAAPLVGDAAAAAALPAGGDAPGATVTTVIRRAGFLHRVPLFRDVSAGYVAAVARLARAVPVFAGETLFAAGARGDALYVIESGRVAIRIDDRHVGALERGDFVGEMALIDGAPRSATAVVEESGRVLRIDAASFANLVATTPAIGAQLLRELAARLRRATRASR